MTENQCGQFGISLLSECSIIRGSSARVSANEPVTLHHAGETTQLPGFLPFCPAALFHLAVCLGHGCPWACPMCDSFLNSLQGARGRCFV